VSAFTLAAARLRVARPGVMMRFVILALALLGVGGPALAAADPAPTTQPERTATPAAAVPSPAASQAAAPKTAAPALSSDEQRLLSQGYKPQMRNGEKIYCRREAELGSRIPAAQHCGTVAQLTTATQDGKDFTQQAQRTQINPTGN
jgi:hypothetical protein